MGKAAGLAAAGFLDGPFGMIAAMIMARANRAAKAQAVAELAPFPKTGLRSHRHRQPHGPDALGQPERHETPDPARVLTPWNPGSTASGSGSDSGSTVGGHGCSTGSGTPARCLPATTASEIVNRSARESVLMSGTEAAIAGAVASPQCFPADRPWSCSYRRFPFPADGGSHLPVIRCTA
jgi:hypothetical protein